MSPIEPAGTAGFTRGTAAAPAPLAAKSGSERAQAVQAAATAPAAAPIESSLAVIQAQAAEAARMAAEQRPAARAASPKSAPRDDIADHARKAAQNAPGPVGKPMTAVLLHELRLQQELAELQQEKEGKTG